MADNPDQNNLATLASYIRAHPQHSRSFALRLADMLDVGAANLKVGHMLGVAMRDGDSAWLCNRGQRDG